MARATSWFRGRKAGCLAAVLVFAGAYSLYATARVGAHTDRVTARCTGQTRPVSGIVLADQANSLLVRPAYRQTALRLALSPGVRLVRDGIPLTGAAQVTRGDTVAGSACQSVGGQLVTAGLKVVAGIHRIRHVIVIMQENRSFDEYFGTYPGADGIPMRNGVPVACVPVYLAVGCIRPYHDSNDLNLGGPHDAVTAVYDIDGGRMDGFVEQAMKFHVFFCNNSPALDFCTNPRSGTDVMGYHDARELPNYWSYARHFVLQDHMFEPNLGWSLPAHLFMVSGWSAQCSDPQNPYTCKSDLDLYKPFWTDSMPDFGWTDITYLLHNRGISWGYYVDQGAQPDCVDGAAACSPAPQLVGSAEVWNPLPAFVTVHEDAQLGNIQPASNFLAAARAGSLPAVSWVVPNQEHSEHPPALVSAGQNWVTSLVNAVMQGPDWRSSAIFISWDDWGGFYDHVVPTLVDQNGYGLRVPGLVISPYARRGFIDHQLLSHDAYLKFIEDDFLAGQRLDPRTDGRPDPRPTVRETVKALGDLADDFDFAQAPRPPMILGPVTPHT